MSLSTNLNSTFSVIVRSTRSLICSVSVAFGLIGSPAPSVTADDTLPTSMQRRFVREKPIRGTVELSEIGEKEMRSVHETLLSKYRKVLGRREKRLVGVETIVVQDKSIKDRKMIMSHSFAAEDPSSEFLHYARMDDDLVKADKPDDLESARISRLKKLGRRDTPRTERLQRGFNLRNGVGMYHGQEGRLYLYGTGLLKSSPVDLTFSFHRVRVDLLPLTTPAFTHLFRPKVADIIEPLDRLPKRIVTYQNGTRGVLMSYETNELEMLFDQRTDLPIEIHYYTIATREKGESTSGDSPARLRFTQSKTKTEWSESKPYRVQRIDSVWYGDLLPDTTFPTVSATYSMKYIDPNSPEASAYFDEDSFGVLLPPIE